MRTTTLTLYLFLLLLSGCSGLILREDDSGLETTGKVMSRILLCPVTICFSELAIRDEREKEVRAWKEQEYRHWLSTLSPEQRAQEYALEQARIQAAGQALMGLGFSGGPFRMPAPQPAVQPSRTTPPVSCTSNQIGASVYTNCY